MFINLCGVIAPFHITQYSLVLNKFHVNRISVHNYNYIMPLTLRNCYAMIKNSTKGHLEQPNGLPNQFYSMYEVHTMNCINQTMFKLYLSKHSEHPFH